MNNLKSYKNFTNESRFGFGSDKEEASPNRELLRKKRQQILQKLSAIKQEITNQEEAAKQAPKTTDFNVAAEAEINKSVQATSEIETVAKLNIQLESLRKELREVNCLLS